MAKKITFKSLVPGTFSYHQSKLWEGLEYPLFRMNLDIVRKVVEDTKQEAAQRFGSYTTREGLRGTIEDMEFILDRLTQWDDTKADLDKRDLYVYLEALGSHLNLLFEMFNEMDAE